MPDMYMDVDTALSEVPVNIFPLTDDSDFKTVETGVAFNAAGMTLVWEFTTTGGATTQTVVTPTSGGSYDWNHQGNGMYTIEIPASGGASINNDTEGFGQFVGRATGVLPWRGPVIGFRAAGLNNLLIDDAYSTTRGLAGTALPAAAADAVGGLPISDAGGLDLDAILVDTGTIIPAQIAALNNISPAQVNAEVVDVLRTDTIPDSYSADGAQPTIVQAILAILQFLTEKEVSGTTVTVNKPNGSTVAMTFTLDDATTPTSITRSS